VKVAAGAIVNGEVVLDDERRRVAEETGALARFLAMHVRQDAGREDSPCASPATRGFATSKLLSTFAPR
jgi:hypothetical protein